MLPRDNTAKINGAGNKPLRVLQHITFPVEINGKQICHLWVVVQSLSFALLAGRDFMARHRFVLAYRDDGDVIRVEKGAPCNQCQEILPNTVVQVPKQPAAPVGETQSTENVN